MSQNGNSIKWNKDTGSITVAIEGKEERVFIVSSDFLGAFKQEMINTAGKTPLTMMIRKTLENFGKAHQEGSEYSWESLEQLNDRHLLPISTEGADLPKEYNPWDGKTRNLVLSPDIPMSMLSVRSIQTFKHVISDVMTERGGNALMNACGKKSGMAIGGRFLKYFGWKDMNHALGSIDEIARKMTFAAGWSKSRAVTQTGKDGNPMILLKSWNSYEADNVTSPNPVCVITSSLLNGIWNTFAETLSGQAAEAREVKCSAKGDDYCAFAVKIKDKSAPHLDWKELEEEWKALDAQ